MLPLFFPLVVAPDLCATRPGQPCHLSPAQEAGPGLQVVEVAWHDLGEPGREVNRPCAPYSWFLVAGFTATEILRTCNDGYGAAMLGEDEVTVSPGQLVHRQFSGSNWRRSTTRTYSLDPLALVKEDWFGMWTAGPNAEEGTWEVTTHRGLVSWYAPGCEAPDDSPPEMAPDVPPYRYAPIPSIPTTPLLSGVDWARQAPGACGTRVDSAGQGGFVIHGTPSSPTDASFDVLAMVPEGQGTKWLLVEVRDDVFVREPVGKKPSWVKADHLELWLGPPVGYWNSCLQGEKPVQYAILLDGRVISAAGHPPSTLTVDVDTQPDRVRFRLRLPEEYSGISLVYSDSDDGAGQERLIATSPLGFGRPETLGTYQPVDACDTRSGVLQWKPAEPPLGSP